MTLRLAAWIAISAVAGLADPMTAPQALEAYLRSSEASCSAGDQAMEVDIQASLPKLKKEGTMHGLKVITGSGQVAYRFLRFTGDKLIKTDVIARFLSAESQPPSQIGNVSTTTQNYKFRFHTVGDHEGAKAYVFDLKPRKKRVGLFKGELWLDAETGAPVREAGEFVKSPSIFIHRIRFVREYTGSASCAAPRRTSITVQTRIAGDAEMVVLQHPVDPGWHPADADGPIVRDSGENGH
jgi:hypothetical protein